MKTAIACVVTAALGLTPTVLLAAPPHVHGVGILQLVLDENSLSMELHLPAIDVVGFEHAPSDPQQREAVQKAVAMLKDASQLLVLPRDAQCTAAPAVVSSELLPTGHSRPADTTETEHADRDADHDHEAGHEHADFDVSYRFDCRRPDLVEDVTILLFKQLPKLERLDVDMATPGGQDRQRLTPEQDSIDLP
ncbi:MAG TPA: DUF2796 domain-containing protein [Candidatus Competibacteraceae bacterium]|nr:DUF2796 domain-containing protein [Candidatus Competibacteraceae bacterium]HQD55030.1 DUF2796 domain-containing protein [Candidatus Competibacteraceae bacterium]